MFGSLELNCILFFYNLFSYIDSRLASNSLYSQGEPWTRVQFFSFHFQSAGIYRHAETVLGLCGAGDGTQSMLNTLPVKLNPQPSFIFIYIYISKTKQQQQKTHIKSTFQIIVIEKCWCFWEITTANFSLQCISSVWSESLFGTPHLVSVLYKLFWIFTKHKKEYFDHIYRCLQILGDSVLYALELIAVWSQVIIPLPTSLFTLKACLAVALLG